MLDPVLVDAIIYRLMLCIRVNDHGAKICPCSFIYSTQYCYSGLATL